MEVFEFRPGDRVIYAGLAGDPKEIGIVLKCVGLSESFELEGRNIEAVNPYQDELMYVVRFGDDTDIRMYGESELRLAP